MISVGEMEGTQENPEVELVERLKKLYLNDDDPSPRGVLENLVLGADSDHSSSSSSSSCSSSSSSSTAERLIGDGAPEARRLQWKNLVSALKKKSARRLSTIPLLTHYEMTRKNLMKRRLGRFRSAEDAINCEGMPVPKPSWRSFDYHELAAATDSFSTENLIGKGGHAEVYKGCLSDGQVVAVKRLTKKEENEEERVGDFLSELGIIAHINHPHAARLIGFSVDGGLHLILQLASHGSLASVLHGSGEILPWSIRFKVALGVAEGLKYLHHDCQRRIIHRDIKASNILLSEGYEPQISDFGLAKWLPEKWSHHVFFPIEGTFGYLSPEYFMHGIANEKTDVFAFGVLLLELITGRRAVDSCRQSLVMWAKPLLDKNSVRELVDPRLRDDYELSEMKRAMHAASICINHLSTRRPEMNRVVQILRGEERYVDLKQKSMMGRPLLLDSCDLEDYTCSSYLNDLNRHMQLVLE
ncbi:receptor-like cytosolic serine/threonine-protein kinase RBK1 [Malania oleifera]|uniref:receptor-like cytosolic serine/threonine-protein kinase RBK1 n=1 Tax=Malania oleifera TaxID=397392 RepID=UPI0025ADC29B|nr:receptor-like cytosolic serine/threonine-protein kinase RBK1 [Malania oleifera]